MARDRKKPHTVGAMMLLPAKEGTCPVCAVKHDPHEPHDATSLFYQYYFYGLHERWPTWADAIAHCTSDLRDAWRTLLKARGKWSEPADGEAIAVLAGATEVDDCCFVNTLNGDKK